MSAVRESCNVTPGKVGLRLLDAQWSEHYPELVYLTCRKLAPYMSAQDREALRHKLFQAAGELVVSTAPFELANTPNLASDLAEAVEDSICIESICERFGAETVEQLVRWAVLTSEEDIKAYLQS
jgi:hypothetical protein